MSSAITSGLCGTLRTDHIGARHIDIVRLHETLAERGFPLNKFDIKCGPCISYELLAKCSLGYYRSRIRTSVVDEHIEPTWISFDFFIGLLNSSCAHTSACGSSCLPRDYVAAYEESLTRSTSISSTILFELGHSLRTLSTAAFPFSSERAPRRTWYGLVDCNKAFTISYPMPLFPPVTNTTFGAPIMLVMVSDFSAVRC